jgi:chromosomal replication initiator protein
MDAFWILCLQHFEHSLPQQQFRTWIQPLRPRRNGKTLILEAPNRFVLQWVKDRFLPVIEQLARDHQDGSGIHLELAQRAGRETAAVAAAAVAAAPVAVPPASDTRPKVRETSRLNPVFTFDSFVTGKANQLARAAAMQVAEHPGTAYNPLFIYGGVGLGKTHLLQAIGNLVQENKAQAKIRYIHAEQYVSDVVRAYQHKAFDGFKKYYHSLDLLLIDDIQFFGGKNRTQ